MRLEQLIKNLNIKELINYKDIDIQDIVYNSKNATSNTIFTALIGMSIDGHKYITDAYSKGVRVFLISDSDFIGKKENKDIMENSTIIVVDDTRDALANISDTFFNHPSKELIVIGITGTKGKTTVSNYIKIVLENANISCGVIGTNGIYFCDKYVKTLNTTPESYELQKYMREMVDNNVKILAMEVSSGGIMMNRTNYVDFDYAIFTNLSHDHIGEKEHPTFEHYMYCKAKLFAMSKKSIINIDDEHSEVMSKNAKHITTYSIDKDADLVAKNIKFPKKISDLKTYFTVGNNEYMVHSFGKFGVYNALCVVSVCFMLGLDYNKIKTGLEKAYVKGRLQILNILEDIPVVIDYAHNQISLENILKTIKDLKPKRIIIVFGSVGTRSQSRRKELAQVASFYSDIIIVTSDNPDTENPQKIIDEIVSHISKDKLKHTLTYVDRADAIKKAVDIAKKGDVILLAGKGHEEYQIINGIREHFSDEEEIRNYVESIKN